MISFIEFLMAGGLVYGGIKKTTQGKKDMEKKMEAEVYKGILYVNISKLPAGQKQLIKESRTIRKIKIKKGEDILTDCIYYIDYERWHKEEYEKVLRNAVL